MFNLPIPFIDASEDRLPCEVEPRLISNIGFQTYRCLIGSCRLSCSLAPQVDYESDPFSVLAVDLTTLRAYPIPITTAWNCPTTRWGIMVKTSLFVDELPFDTSLGVPVYQDGEVTRVSTRQLRPGHCIPVLRSLPPLSPEPCLSVSAGGLHYKKTTRVEIPLTREFGTFLGIVIGDGWVDSSDHIVVTGSSDSIYRTMKRIVSMPTLPWERVGKRESYVSNGSYLRGGKLGKGEKKRFRISQKTWLNRWIADHIGRGALRKTIPNFSFDGSEEHRLGLLDGLLSTDGSVSVVKAKSKPSAQLQVSFSTSSPSLRDGFLLLCRSLGVRAHATQSKSPTSGNPHWAIQLGTTDMKRLFRSGFRLSEEGKNRRLREGLVSVDEASPAAARNDLAPYPRHVHKELCALKRPVAKATAGRKEQTIAVNLSNGKKRGYWSRLLAEEYDRCDHVRERGSQALLAYLELVRMREIGWTSVVRVGEELCTLVDTPDDLVSGRHALADEHGVLH